MEKRTQELLLFGLLFELLLNQDRPRTPAGVAHAAEAHGAVAPWGAHNDLDRARWEGLYYQEWFSSTATCGGLEAERRERKRRSAALASHAPKVDFELNLLGCRPGRAQQSERWATPTSQS